MSSIVAEQIYETATREIPQIVWAEFTSLILPIYSSVGSQPPYEIHLPVNTVLSVILAFYSVFIFLISTVIIIYYWHYINIGFSTIDLIV